MQRRTGPVLIDGNNLLFAVAEIDIPQAPGRLGMCALLDQWAARYDTSVHVVFDGPSPPAGLARQIAQARVSVTYSGAGVSADTVLADTLDAEPAARTMIVVSSDKDVRRAAKRRRAKPIGSHEFWKRVRRDLATPPAAQPAEPAEKYRGLDPEDTEFWLREMGLDE